MQYMTIQKYIFVKLTINKNNEFEATV